MAKYNYTPKREKVARYQTLLSDKLKDSLYEGILRIIVAEGKYKDKTYNTRRLAADLNTNARYISAVCATRLHKNYSEFVNVFRVNEAMSLLSDRRYTKMTIEDISDMAGFNTRQSLYANFYHRMGMTPCEYRKAQAKKKKEAGI